MKKRLKVLCVFDLVAPPSGPDLLEELETEDWKTERHVLSALGRLGHNVAITAVLDDVTPLIAKVKSEKPDVIFNLTEHFAGDRALDKSVAAVLDLLGVPYTGAGPMGLGLARDKALAKKILTYHRVRVPAFTEFRMGRRFRVPRKLPFPAIVKPVGEDASEGLANASVVRNDRQLAERVAFVHESLGRHAIAEEYVDGQEIYCSILGNRRLQVLPLRTVWLKEKPGSPGFMTYRLKWDVEYQRSWGLEFGFAVDLPKDVERRIGQVSKRAYRVLELLDYGRVDLRVTADGRIHVLEANPNPYLASNEDFALSAAEAGIDYDSLIERLLRMALRRED